MIYGNEQRRYGRHLKTTQAMLTGAILVGGTLLFGGVVQAAAGRSTVHGASTTSSSSSTAQQTRTALIISKGNQEIERRLTTLRALDTKITSAVHLTSSDQSTRKTEVNTTTTGLTGLKAQLDAAATVSEARTDASDIYTEYRVYALVAPKVGLVKVADDQQVVQNKLSALSSKLQTRVSEEQQAGKNVVTLQNELAEMNSLVSAAHKISAGIESSTINLQPSDYNQNHEVLTGDNTQLQTARADDATAYNEAKNIVTTLKTMS